MSDLYDAFARPGTAQLTVPPSDPLPTFPPVTGVPTTKYEWDAFLEYTAPPAPALPTLTEYRRMSDAERDACSKARHAHHDRMVLVQLQRMTEIHELLTRMIRRASNQAGDARIRKSLLLSGYGSVGKTTCMKLFALQFERNLRATQPEAFQIPGVDVRPVAMVRVPSPPGARSPVTPKLVARVIARFYDIPHRRDADADTLKVALLKAIRMCRTRLLILDDVNNIEDTRGTGHAVVAFFKQLMEESGIVVVLIGNDMENSSLLADDSTARRLKFRVYEAYSLPPEDRTELKQAEKEAVKEWYQLVLALEEHLRLFGHQPGDLSKHYRYLHERSQGRIGDLVELVQEAADAAMELGEEKGHPSQERITMALLTRVTASSAGERARSSHR